MENKYYTPNIEEIYVGFELEWQSKIRKETWNKQICDVDLIAIFYDDYEHADEEEPFDQRFRVKYIDKEDIESLGFHKHKKEYWLYQDNSIIILTIIEDTYISITENYGPGYENTLFKGNIKNKSELKVLLKQLGINEDR